MLRHMRCHEALIDCFACAVCGSSILCGHHERSHRLFSLCRVKSPSLSASLSGSSALVLNCEVPKLNCRPLVLVISCCCVLTTCRQVTCASADLQGPPDQSDSLGCSVRLRLAVHFNRDLTAVDHVGGEDRATRQALDDTCRKLTFVDTLDVLDVRVL